MKMKMSLGEGGIKGLAAKHIEKFIFGAVILLVAYFVYSSATGEGLGSGENPADLKRLATSAQTHITADNWDQLKDERVNLVEDYPAKTELARSKILEKDYALSYIWDKQPIPNLSRRSDPQMYPPAKVEAYAVFGPVAVKTSQPVDPFANDKTAVAKPKEEPKKKKTKKPKPKLAANPYGFGGEFGGGNDDFGGNYDEESSGSEFGMEGSGADSYSQSFGAGREGARRIGKFYREHYLTGGWQPPGAGGVGNSRMVAKSLGVVGVTALVPYERQWEEFERALAGAQGYNPKADSPKYLYFLAQRAEVPADPNAELQWVDITNSARAMAATQAYAGTPREVADEAYAMPGVLTMPIAPVLYTPLDRFALHSEVPRQQRANTQNRMAANEDDPQIDPLEAMNQKAGDISDGILEIPKVGPGAGGGYGGESYGGAGSYESAGMDEFDDGGYDDAGGSGYDDGGYGAGSYGSAVQQPLVKHKMIRFFDFSAQSGKTYRYRVSVMLEDPNRPKDPKAAPNSRILDDSVTARLRQVAAEDAQKAQQLGKTRRTYYIQTEWSEPSDPVSVVQRDDFLASGVTPGRTVPLSRNGPFVEMDEPVAKVVAIVWDDQRAVEVPAEREVRRGAFLNFDQDADVMHPLTQQLKTIVEFPFRTEAFVADVRGGESMSDRKAEEPLQAPGECLIIDGNGNLVVRNDLDSTEEYRRVMFVADEAEAGVGGGMMSPYDSGGEMGMSEFENYENEDSYGN